MLSQQPPTHQYGYPESQATLRTYGAPTTAAYDTSAYAARDIKPDVGAVMNDMSTVVSHQPTPQPAMIPHAPPPPTSNSMPSAYPQSTQTPAFFHPMPSTAVMSTDQNYYQYGPAAWRNFADSMTTNMGGQDYLSSANALMALGGAGTKPDGTLADGGLPLTSAMTGATFEGMPMPSDGTQSWPLIQYTIGPQPDGQ